MKSTGEREERGENKEREEGKKKRELGEKKGKNSERVERAFVTFSKWLHSFSFHFSLISSSFI